MTLTNRGIVTLGGGLVVLGAVIGLGIWAGLRPTSDSVQFIEQEANVLEVRKVHTVSHAHSPSHQSNLVNHNLLLNEVQKSTVQDAVTTQVQTASEVEPQNPPINFEMPVSNPFESLDSLFYSDFNQRRIGLPYKSNINPNVDPSPRVVASPIPIAPFPSPETPSQWNSTETAWDQEVFQVVDLLKLVSQSFMGSSTGEDNWNQSDYGTQVPEPTQRAYRQSLPALSYLGMGILLMRRIHQLVGLTKSSLDQARHLDGNSNPHELKEFPALDLLFLDSENARSLLSTNASSVEDAIPEMENLLDEQDSVSASNNMIRVVLNLINAYLHQDDEVMDCLWSLYCDELDRNALNHDITAIVARLNSVGLDLILLRLSPVEALAQLLQRLTSWQGLQCSQVFPNCPRAQAEQKLLRLVLKSGSPSSHD